MGPEMDKEFCPKASDFPESVTVLTWEGNENCLVIKFVM